MHNMNSFFAYSSFLLSVGISLAGNRAYAQNTPSGPALNLTGFTLQYDSDGATLPALCTGSRQWYGPAQLGPQPFTSSTATFCEGNTPSDAFGVIGAKNGNDVVSGYSGESEVYFTPGDNTDFSTRQALMTSTGELAFTLLTLNSTEKALIPSGFGAREYASAAINSYPYAAQYGYWEVTLRVPAGAGSFPAAWLVPENQNISGSPDIEADFMEAAGSNTSVFHQTVHAPSLSGGQTSEAWHYLNWNLSTGLNAYGVDIEPALTCFYFKQIQSYCITTPAELKQPMILIINEAVGTGFDSTQTWTSSSLNNKSLWVDHIRYWSSSNTVPVN